nr:expressed conserved protein [Hymenolepis microstoma]
MPSSIGLKRTGSDKPRGPLKAFQLPTSASTPYMTKNKFDGRNGPKTYWTDSEDSSRLLSTAECSFQSTGSPRSVDENVLSKKPSPVGVERSGLKQHFPVIIGIKRNNSYLFDQKKDAENCGNFPCACCCSPVLPPKRAHVVMGAEGLKLLRGIPSPFKPLLNPSATPPETSLAPVCSVPMPPSFLTPQSQLGLDFPGRRSIASQTSPVEIDKKKSKRRSSSANGGGVLSSIKKKITSLKSSMSTDKFPSRALFRDIPSPMKMVKPTHSSSEVTTCTILQRFPDGSRVVQLRRACPSAQFGLYVRDDEDKGMIVSRIGLIKFSEKNNFLNRGDRVLEVEHVPSSKLDCDGMRKLLDGRLTATIKVANSPSHNEHRD